ncbi:MAG: hypothetical protein AB1473_02535 [Thermodesulfobacteriota bacterium]
MTRAIAKALVFAAALAPVAVDAAVDMSAGRNVSGMPTDPPPPSDSRRTGLPPSHARLDSLDSTVVNVTRDRIWIRDAALPEFSETARPNPQWLIREMFDGKIPTTFPKLKYTIAGNQEQAIRDLEIPPEIFTPKDQMRKWVREWPENVTREVLFGGMPSKE